LALHREDYIDALAHAEQAMELTEHPDDRLNRCDVLRILGDTQLALNQPEQAVGTFDRLIELADPFPCRRAEGHEGAAAAALVLEQLEAARNHLAIANQIRHHTGSQRVRRPAVEHYLMRLETEPHPAAATRAEVNE
jgi:tetratricopeptide (TPR) repeat protein